MTFKIFVVALVLKFLLIPLIFAYFMFISCKTAYNNWSEIVNIS